MTYETLTLDKQGHLATIKLNRPKIFNPLDEVSGAELVAALEKCGWDNDIRVVILTGEGKAFSAGGNVRMMKSFVDDHPDLDGGQIFEQITKLLNRSILTIRNLPKPVVAALNGVASGGGLSWVLACDMVIAADTARLDTGYIRIAVNPDGGLSWILPRLIGHKRATEFLMLAEEMSAAKALELGLVNKMVPEKDLLSESIILATRLSKKPALALAATKRLMNGSVFYGLAAQLERERQEIIQAGGTHDFKEGLAAFFEKRPPAFNTR
ncbi:MAG: enoyl-CoA hydratase/isomerase family protein [Deltaproteobacteria bacterium]|nr:enoyl-CoA hydratase/isomerase family protein [Deltaproteobacteria bacterium]